MTRTCRCGNEADDMVFGPCRKCSPEPARAPAQYDGDPDDWTELRPYERTLSDGDGDLG